MSSNGTSYWCGHSARAVASHVGTLCLNLKQQKSTRVAIPDHPCRRWSAHGPHASPRSVIPTPLFRRVDELTGRVSTERPRPGVDARGGLFCDEPGLGKTVTVLALLLATQGLYAEAPEARRAAELFLNTGLLRYLSPRRCS